MQNSARFLQFHFTHYQPHQKDKTVLGTTKTRSRSRKIALIAGQAQKIEKLTNAIKYLICGHFKNRKHLVNEHIIFSRIIVHQSKSYVSISKRCTPLSNQGIRIRFPIVTANQSFTSRLKLVQEQDLYAIDVSSI